MNKFLLIFALACAVLLASCSAARQGAETDSKKSDQNQTNIIDVSTAPVLERRLRRDIEVVGSLEAEDQVTVSSLASGTLEEISVDVGTPVRRGQVIARIDMRELRLRFEQAQAALRQAEARLGDESDPRKNPEVKQAEAALERARYDFTAAQNLVEKGDISRQQYDIARRAFEQAEARYEAALENFRNLQAAVQEKRAALALAKKQLEDATITSPISGIVKQKLASRGEYLQPGKPIAAIVQINPLRLKLEVPEAFASSIKIGLEVKLKVDAFPGREFSGRITRINPSLDERNRSLSAIAEVDNRSGLLRPGMFARARIASGSDVKALMVPEKALAAVAGVTKLYVLDGGRALERRVKTGIRDGDLVEILEGVSPGERIITSNLEKLFNGATVSAR
jgi:multidrug efflux pump subunit AcrA (membrane-fusion protein)